MGVSSPRTAPVCDRVMGVSFAAALEPPEAVFAPTSATPEFETNQLWRGYESLAKAGRIGFKIVWSRTCPNHCVFRSLLEANGNLATV